MATKEEYLKLTKEQLANELLLRDANPDDKDLRIGELEKENAQKDKTIAEQQKELERMSEAVNEEKPPSGVKSFGTFKHKGVTYDIVAPKFKHRGNPYAASELMDNEQMQAEMVQMNAGIIKVREAK